VIYYTKLQLRHSEKGSD